MLPEDEEILRIGKTVSTADNPEKVIVVGLDNIEELEELGLPDGFVEMLVGITRTDVEYSMYDLMKELESYEEGLKIKKIQTNKPRKKPKIKNNNPTYGKHNKGFGGGNRNTRANVQFRGRR